MTALIRRTVIPSASRGAVDRAMRALGLSGIRRDKGIRTTIPAKDGVRAGDLLNRDFTAPRPDHTWVMDFTYCRTWAGWVYVAFIVDVYSQRIVAWHAQTTKHVELVMIPLRMALWERARDGHPVQPEQLRADSPRDVNPAPGTPGSQAIDEDADGYRHDVTVWVGTGRTHVCADCSSTDGHPDREAPADRPSWHRQPSCWPRTRAGTTARRWLGRVEGRGH